MNQILLYAVFTMFFLGIFVTLQSVETPTGNVISEVHDYGSVYVAQGEYFIVVHGGTNGLAKFENGVWVKGSHHLSSGVIYTEGVSVGDAYVIDQPKLDIPEFVSDTIASEEGFYYVDNGKEYWVGK